MCYTGACMFESYPNGCNEGCVCTARKGDLTPCEGYICPECELAYLEEGLRGECAGGTYREVDILYCPNCEYEEER